MLYSKLLAWSVIITTAKDGLFASVENLTTPVTLPVAFIWTHEVPGNTHPPMQQTDMLNPVGSYDDDFT